MKVAYLGEETTGQLTDVRVRAVTEQIKDIDESTCRRGHKDNQRVLATAPRLTNSVINLLLDTRACSVSSAMRRPTAIKTEYWPWKSSSQTCSVRLDGEQKVNQDLGSCNICHTGFVGCDDCGHLLSR